MAEHDIEEAAKVEFKQDYKQQEEKKKDMLSAN